MCSCSISSGAVMYGRLVLPISAGRLKSNDWWGTVLLLSCTVTRVLIDVVVC